MIDGALIVKQKESLRAANLFLAPGYRYGILVVLRGCGEEDVRMARVGLGSARDSGAAKKELSDDERALLRDLSFARIGPANVLNGRAWVGVCENLVILGLAAAHRANIGESSETATYTITDAGKLALGEARS